MGNSICFDCDEFYLKFSYTTNKKPSELDIFKYIIWTEFKSATFNSCLGKVLLTDISDHLLTNNEDVASIRKFVKEEFLKDTEDKTVEINITRNGYSTYKAQITTFMGKFLNKYAFHEHENMNCIALGLDFLKSISPQTHFYSIEGKKVFLNYVKPEDCTPDKRKYIDISNHKGDIMAVSIDNTISYYHLDEEGNQNKVSGSIIGDSVFAALIRLLAGYENFHEAFDQGMQGDYKALDMTVGDVYGEGCSTMGLMSEIPASCMGKAQHFEKEEVDKVDKKDIAKSLILMFVINLGMMTNLVVDSVPGVKTVVVLGFPHLGFQTLLSTIFPRYDKHSKQLLYVDNSEFVGCIGMNLITKKEA